MSLTDLINSSLQTGATPLEMIKANLRTSEPIVAKRPEPEAPVAPTGQTSPQVAQSIVQGNGLDISLPFETEPFAQPKTAPAPEVKPEPEIQKEENSLLELVTEGKKSKEDSIKDLRQKANELKTQLEEKETILGTLQGDLERYKTGEALPDVIKAKEERIAQLEQYEQLHGLRFSPEYQKKYVEPLEAAKTQAVKLAEEYQVDPMVLNQALAIEGKRELNAFLKDHFDDVGALEVRDVLAQIKTLENETARAEEQPAIALGKLREEFQVQSAEQEKQRLTSIAATSRDGWIKALVEVREKGEYPELTLTGDPKQDEVVIPILDSSAQEYGKFVKMLAELGVKELPSDVAKITAKRFLLSQASAVMAQSRAHHYQRSEDILNQTRRTQSMTRPPVGMTSGGGSSPAPARSMTPDSAADVLLGMVRKK